jgi:CheY-like chemotaxis protein
MLTHPTIRILLADDDGDDRFLFEHAYAKRRDVTILLPGLVNGKEVIDMLNKTNEDGDLPDLIILDHNMPLMNGKQTLTLLKSSPRFASIPVCIYSTYADKSLVDSCLKLGAYKVASKPITEAEYQTMLDDFLSYRIKEE